MRRHGQKPAMSMGEFAFIKELHQEGQAEKAHKFMRVTKRMDYCPECKREIQP